VEETAMGLRKAQKDDGQPLLIKGLRPPKQEFRNLRNYLAGQFVGATRDDALLDEVLKCLFCRLYLETDRITPPDEPFPDAFSGAQFYRAVFAQVRADFPEIYDAGAELLLDPKSLLHVLRSLDFPLLDAKSDPVGDAFEVFAGSESRARAGQFFTPYNAMDLLVKMVDPKPGQTVIDPACGAGGFLASVVRHHRASGCNERELAAAVSSLYGIEKDGYLANLARLHVSLLSGGHPKVVCGDSLAMRDERREPLKLPDGFDVVLTNPPFGVKIVAASPEVQRAFALGWKWRLDQTKAWQQTSDLASSVPPQVLFVERCLSLARPGGRLGLVLPESVLSNKSYRYVVEFLRGKAQVDGVVGMPEALFKTSGKGGTHTKTCLITLTKLGERGNGHRRGKVFMAEAKWCGKDSRAREIPNDDLPAIGENFANFKSRKKLVPSRLGFIVEDKDLEENVLCPRYYDPELDADLAALHQTHEIVRFGDLVNEGCLRIMTGDEVGKLAYGGGDIPFVRTSDISNWEIKIDPKHTVDRALYETLKGKQDVRPCDVLMVKDGTYLIGTCAMVSEYDREIVFQSHLYKIRVEDERHGLNPYLLLAVLSAPIVQRQIRAKQFTQDIIDSLGERIHELLLPLPKSAQRRRNVTEMVKKVIEDRIEARELARKAVLTVAG
jgi:type I restriction enzyme M protein